MRKVLGVWALLTLGVVLACVFVARRGPPHQERTPTAGEFRWSAALLGGVGVAAFGTLLRATCSLAAPCGGTLEVNCSSGYPTFYLAIAVIGAGVAVVAAATLAYLGRQKRAA